MNAAPHLNAGVWIDHRRAVIVTGENGKEDVKVIESHVERQPRRMDLQDGKISTVREPIPAENRRERKVKNYLKIYYDTVIAQLRDADNIVVYGPGEAKKELSARMRRNKLRGASIVTAAAEELTERQLLEKVRRHFSVPPSSH